MKDLERKLKALEGENNELRKQLPDAETGKVNVVIIIVIILLFS